MSSEVGGERKSLWTATALLGALLLNYSAWALGWAELFASATLMLYLTILLGFLCAPGTWTGHLPWTKLFLVALALIALGTVTSSWDARSIWMFHGKRIFLASDLYAQLDGYFGLSHNDYPVLVPALAASLARLLGAWNEVVPKLAGMLLWIPALLVILELLPSVTARLLFLAATLLINGAGLIDGMVDMPLAMVVVACAAVMQRLLDLSAPPPGAAAPGTLPRTLLALPALLLALMSLTKNEGIALAVLLLLTFTLLAATQRSLARLWPTLLAGLASFAWVVAWALACQASGIMVDLGPGAMERLAGRVLMPDSHALIIGEIFGSKMLMTCILIATFGIAGSTPRARQWALPLFVAALYLSVIYAVYLSTPNDLRWHLGSSASRILHSVELLLVYVGLAALFTGARKREPVALPI